MNIRSPLFIGNCCSSRLPTAQLHLQWVLPDPLLEVLDPYRMVGRINSLTEGATGRCWRIHRIGYISIFILIYVITLREAYFYLFDFTSDF